MTRAIATALAIILTLPAHAEMCRWFPIGGVWVSADAAMSEVLPAGHWCTTGEFRRIRDGLADYKARLFVAKVDLRLAKKKVELYIDACNERVGIDRRTCATRLLIVEDQLRIAQGGGRDWWTEFWGRNGVWVAIVGTLVGAAVGAVVTWRVVRN